MDVATLEYYRKLSESLTAESRELLKGSSIIAGDYEVAAAGVYGDDIQVFITIRKDISESRYLIIFVTSLQMSAQSELIPLLKQLIALLDSGINFQLAPEMLTALQQTQSSQQQVKA